MVTSQPLGRVDSGATLIIAKLNDRFGGDYSPCAVDAVVTHVMNKLAVDYDLKAMINVREETPQIIDDIVADSDIFAMPAKALFPYLDVARGS